MTCLLLFTHTKRREVWYSNSMDYLPYILTAALVILVIVLTVVGVQLFRVLLEVQRTLKKVNDTLDTVDHTVASITQPLHSLGGMASGLTAGFKVFETFVGWLNRSKSER